MNPTELEEFRTWLREEMLCEEPTVEYIELLLRHHDRNPIPKEILEAFK